MSVIKPGQMPPVNLPMDAQGRLQDGSGRIVVTAEVVKALRKVASAFHRGSGGIRLPGDSLNERVGELLAVLYETQGIAFEVKT